MHPKRQNLVTVISSSMKNLGVLASLPLLLALAACRGTEGDVLRTRPDMSGHDDAGTVRPRPSPLSTWQIQLSGTVATSLDVELYTVDFDTPITKIEALHAAGRIVVCYFSAGTRESFRSDAAEFPAASLGSALVDYPNERWLDIRNDDVSPKLATLAATAFTRVAWRASSKTPGLRSGARISSNITAGSARKRMHRGFRSGSSKGISA